MTDPLVTTPDKRSIWLRSLLMILMAMAFHLATMLLGLLAVVQFVLSLVSDAPNARLCAFGQGQDLDRGYPQAAGTDQRLL